MWKFLHWIHCFGVYHNGTTDDGTATCNVSIIIVLNFIQLALLGERGNEILGN